MVEAIAFDSKEFRRLRLVVDPVTGQQHRQMKFYSPLGVGVTVNDEIKASSAVLKACSELKPKFDMDYPCSLISTTKSGMKFGFSRVIRFYDEVAQSVQEHITGIFTCYVVLPPKDFPFMPVGGVRCPRTRQENQEFLKELNPGFSYITAWYYFGKSGRGDLRCYLDSFSAKQTPAWRDLAPRNPVIYSRGDECNPLIALADMMCLLTDKKLRDEKLELREENVKHVWEPYDFEVEPRYIDYHLSEKYSWKTNQLIDVSPYLAHPIVFLKADGYDMKHIENMDVFPLAVNLAVQEGGCIQGFDKILDTPKVKNGDIFLYAGQDSLRDAKTLQDMKDIEILSFKELPNRLKR